MRGVEKSEQRFGSARDVLSRPPTFAGKKAITLNLRGDTQPSFFDCLRPPDLRFATHANRFVLSNFGWQGESYFQR